MAIREEVIRIINGMSEAELEAEYKHLTQATDQPAADDEFEAAVEALASFSRQVSVSTDSVTLVRDERDWLANRVP